MGEASPAKLFTESGRASISMAFPPKGEFVEETDDVVAQEVSVAKHSAVINVEDNLDIAETSKLERISLAHVHVLSVIIR